MKKIILTVAGLMLVGFGCTSQDDGSFPVVDGEKKPFETNYEVCENPQTGARIYQASFCGDDSCFARFYDENGLLVESTPEMGPGALNNLKPNTEVTNCQLTTEAYFKSQVQE